ncbi:MAG: class I SAM-dependent rRNA methyltransferase, partial [Clostridiales bacterium]|nr:class I SAM-dependent rRNA methyltransferase [Clostridiales bacterium]
MALPRERDTWVTLLPRQSVGLWVYRTQIASVDGETFEPGDIVSVRDHRGRFVGKGFINPASMIQVRLLTRRQEDAIDEKFIRERVQRAWEYRQEVLSETESCRVIFGEADGLPGLIVDKFGDVLVMQNLALGMERWQEVLLEALEDLLRPEGIYARHDVPVREKEGLPLWKGFLTHPFPTRFLIRENGVPLWVDVERGHKTGHFLDQRENRAALKPFVRGKRVLDVFCHTGGFGLHAAHYGASEVTAVDISEEALELAKESARAGGVEHSIRFYREDAFTFLRQAVREGERYDVVILDPPAFAKSKRSLDGAYRGYKEINLQAMKLLRPGGFLVTCSCSSPVTFDMFDVMLLDAAADARRTLRLVERRGQARDHPVILDHPESQYLKCYILQ